jgi:hypothetical protein
VAHDVTNIGIDRDQLSGMAKQANVSRIENGLKLHRYWSSHCHRCAVKDKWHPQRAAAREPMGA